MARARKLERAIANRLRKSCPFDTLMNMAMAIHRTLIHRTLPNALGLRSHRPTELAVWAVRAASGDSEAISPSVLDVRVGKILSCERHPDADALYVEQIDVGENAPRTICSGLVPYLSADELMDASVVVLCNLRARKFRGVISHGMLLCASDKEAGKVEPLTPPEAAIVGERVRIGDDDLEPQTENQMKKKKAWEKLQPLMNTDSEGIATCDGSQMRVASGPIRCISLTNAAIS